MTFAGDKQSPIPESEVKRIEIERMANEKLARETFRAIRNYLFEQRMIRQDAGKEECDIATAKLDRSVVEQITQTTHANHYDTYLEMATLQFEKDALETTNTLTGLANDTMAVRTFELLKIDRENDKKCGPIVVVRLDLDGFKLINDTFGHHAGDVVLKAVGETLTKSLKRAADKAIHFSGDEFGILLTNMHAGTNPDGSPQTIDETAEHVISRILADIENIDLNQLDQNIPAGRRITASAGFKVVPDNSTDDFAVFKKEADKGSIVAKNLKFVKDYKDGSKRVINSNTSLEDHLKTYGITPEAYEQSAKKNGMVRVFDEILTAEAKRKGSEITPEVLQNRDRLMEETISKLEASV
jgi:diguanylate cyclase (GGDEF)-like protein